MILSKVIESLYLKVFVGIVASYEKHDVVIEMVKGNDVKERITESFPREKKQDEAMLEFIENYTDESPFHYIAMLNPIAEQGALPTCSLKKAEDFYDLSTAVTLCQNKRWMLYSDKPELNELQNEYAKPGLDFIFSPFIVIERFFQDKIDSSLALFVLADHDSLSLAIFKEGNLLFAQQLPMEKEETDIFNDLGDTSVSLSFDLEDEGMEEGIDLDDIDAIDDLEGLDDLSDIEDLDAVGDLESFEEHVPEAKPIKVDQEMDEEAELTFNDDFQRFQLIQTGLSSYYGDEKFQQEFIETVFIADGCGVTDDLKQYLEEELFMKVHVRRIDLAAEVVDLAKVESKYAL